MKKVIITIEQTCRLTRQATVDEDEYEAMLASSGAEEGLPDEDKCPEIWRDYEDVDFGDRAYQWQVFDTDNPATPVAEWANSDFPGYTVQMPVTLGQILYGVVDGSLIEASVIGISYRAAEDLFEPEQEISLRYEDDDGDHYPVIDFSDVGTTWFFTAAEAKRHAE